MEKWRRNRRTLLLSPAAWLLLRPFAKTAMALADGVSTPRVFMLMSKAQGIYPHTRESYWVPTGQGDTLKLPKALSPFEPVKKSLNFLCGYDLKAMRMDYNPAVDWHHASAVLFNGGLLASSDKSADDNISPATNESLDWYVATRWNTTPLNLNPYWAPGMGPTTNGDRISWRREANNKIVYVDETLSVADAWNDVFKGLGPDMMAGGARRSAVEKSILDGTISDTTALKQVLGADQRALLDAHETALRDLELRIFAPGAMPMGTNACTTPALQTDVPTAQGQADILKRLGQAQDFLLAVMRCGLRPVLGFHISHANGEQMIPGLWDGGKDLIPPGYGSDKSKYHTDLWHSDTRTDTGYDWMQNLEARFMSFFAKILIGMQDIPAGTTNLLDQSVVLYGTPQSYCHSNQNHSFMMAGSGGGKIKTGRVLKTHDFTNRNGSSKFAHNDVLISTLHALGFSDVTTYGTAQFCKGGVQGFL